MNLVLVYESQKDLNERRKFERILMECLRKVQIGLDFYKSTFNKMFFLKDDQVMLFDKKRSDFLTLTEKIKGEGTTINPLISLLIKQPTLCDEELCICKYDYEHSQLEKFIGFSEECENYDGVIGVAPLHGIKSPLAVSMDEEYLIKKFSESTEGYNWAVSKHVLLTSRTLLEMSADANAANLNLRESLKHLKTKNYSFKAFTDINDKQN